MDTTQDVHAVLVYFITNLDQAGSAPAGGNMVAIAYTLGGVKTAVDLYRLSAFSAAYNRADSQLGGNAIQATGDNTYQLTGASQPGAIAWGLTFNWEAQSFQGLGLAELGNHTWGQWIQSDVLWNWAQYSQNGVWFDIYDFIGETNGTAHVAVNGGALEFTKSQYQLVHTKRAYNSVNHVNYPIPTKFRADNGTEQFDIVMNVSQTTPLANCFPHPIPEYTAHGSSRAVVSIGCDLCNASKHSGVSLYPQWRQQSIASWYDSTVFDH